MVPSLPVNLLSASEYNESEQESESGTVERVDDRAKAVDNRNRYSIESESVRE